MTVTSLAVAMVMFLFGMCHCAVDSVVGTSNCLLVLGILHLSGHTHVQSHMFPVVDCRLSMALEVERWSDSDFLDCSA